MPQPDIATIADIVRVHAADRPDAIAWFIKNHPEIADSQISRLLGTTKATIDQVRNRGHWNAANIKPD